MGIKTWKQEFYSAVSKVSEKNALAHSLKKWSGLTKSNLKKHGVCIIDNYLFNDGVEKDASGCYLDEPHLRIDASTCALCRHNECNPKRGYSCAKCPLMGQNPRGCLGIFGDWRKTHDPKPMIKLLKAAIESQKQN